MERETICTALCYILTILGAGTLSVWAMRLIDYDACTWCEEENCFGCPIKDKEEEE